MGSRGMAGVNAICLRSGRLGGDRSSRIFLFFFLSKCLDIRLILEPTRCAFVSYQALPVDEAYSYPLDHFFDSVLVAFRKRYP